LSRRRGPGGAGEIEARISRCHLVEREEGRRGEGEKRREERERERRQSGGEKVFGQVGGPHVHGLFWCESRQESGVRRLQGGIDGSELIPTEEHESWTDRMDRFLKGITRIEDENEKKETKDQRGLDRYRGDWLRHLYSSGRPARTRREETISVQNTLKGNPVGSKWFLLNASHDRRRWSDNNSNPNGQYGG
jgi:hypothetical protein